MKRINLYMIMILFLLFALTACGSGGETSQGQFTTVSVNGGSTNPYEQAGGSSIVVAQHSWGGSDSAVESIYDKLDKHKNFLAVYYRDGRKVLEIRIVEDDGKAKDLRLNDWSSSHPDISQGTWKGVWNGERAGWFPNAGDRFPIHPNPFGGELLITTLDTDHGNICLYREGDPDYTLYWFNPNNTVVAGLVEVRNGMFWIL